MAPQLESNEPDLNPLNLRSLDVNFFWRDFEYYSQKAERELNSGNLDAAVDCCLKALQTGDGAVEKMEDLAWEHLTQNKSNHDSNRLLTLLAESLVRFSPQSCIGCIAYAKSTILWSDLEEFDTFIEKADKLIVGFKPDEVVGLSICIYRLHVQYQQALHENEVVNSIASVDKVYGNLKRVSDYGGLVLSRIEVASKTKDLSPAVWRCYMKICKDHPLHKDKAPFANEKLRQIQQPES